jgi:hypothetical protein
MTTRQQLDEVATLLLAGSLLVKLCPEDRANQSEMMLLMELSVSLVNFITVMTKVEKAA